VEAFNHSQATEPRSSGRPPLARHPGRAVQPAMTAAATRRTGAGVPSRPEAVLAALAAGMLGPAFDPQVPRRMLEILDRLASRRDRDLLLGVLRVLDSRAGALALTGRPAPVSGLAPAAAEAVLRRWGRPAAPKRPRLRPGRRLG
jgi:hypothetical protein